MSATQFARNVGILLLAYAVIVLIGILSLEILFGPVSFTESPLLITLPAGLLNIFGAVIAGMIIRLLVGSNLICVVLFCWLIFESSVIHFSGSVNPIWLDIGSGIAQGGGVFLGFYAVRSKMQADA